jgi:hypothetical protein
VIYRTANSYAYLVWQIASLVFIRPNVTASALCPSGMTCIPPFCVVRQNVADFANTFVCPYSMIQSMWLFFILLGRNPEPEDFFSSLFVQTGSGAHPAPCTMGTVGPSWGKVRPGRHAYHSPLLVPILRKSRSYTSSPSIRLPWRIAGQLFFTLERGQEIKTVTDKEDKDLLFRPAFLRFKEF